MFFRMHKTGDVSWGGTLGKLVPRERVTLEVVVLIVSASLTFTQMGFITVHPMSDESHYAMTLLAVIAVTALTLGVSSGVLTGVACGLLLCLHAALQPLDVFEAAVS